MAFNVLIVDDSSSTRAVIKKTLEVSGFDIGQVFEAGNGLEALAVLDKDWVDIVLTDLHMPEMDGFTFLKTLQERASESAAPVVVVTTEGREDRIDELFSLGAKTCIQKPFRPEEIKATLMGVLNMDEGTIDDREALGGSDF